MPVKPAAFLMLFLAPLLLPLSYLLSVDSSYQNWFAYLPLLMLQVVLPIVDHIIGEQTDNLDESSAGRVAENPWYRWLTLAAVPVWLFVLAWATTIFAAQYWGTIGQVGWLLSTGYVGGILAINVAHELIHKRSLVERLGGGLLLASVCYGSFKIEHVRGHHRHVATPEDPSSAKLGQWLYAFIPQAIFKNVLNAWRLESQRVKQLGGRWHDNEVLRWTAVSVLIAVLATISFGWLGLGFFLGQSLGTIISLETVNYIEHYGLTRRREGDRYERPNINHSWNSSALLTNLMLLQLARHADHHANPTRRYQVLRHFDESPQLPAGYAAMFLLAWLPPLWMAIMNPRVKALNTRG